MTAQARNSAPSIGDLLNGYAPQQQHVSPLAETVVTIPKIYRPEEHDVRTAIAFLKLLDSNGVHTLWASEPDGRKDGKVFAPGDWDAIAQFVRSHQGWNLHYNPNEIKPDAGRQPDWRGKAKKTDVANIRAVWLDMDPNAEREKAGEGQAERARIKETIEDIDGDMLPNVVLDSGGGYQALWLLKNKLPADQFGTQSENLNRGIANRFKADSVANIDRVLRLPGTVNFPDAAKRARGRTMARATILSQEHDPESFYTLDEIADWTPGIASGSRLPKSPSAGKIIVKQDEWACERAWDWLWYHSPVAVDGELNNMAYAVVNRLLDFGVSEKDTLIDFMCWWAEARCLSCTAEGARPYVSDIIDNAMRYRKSAIGCDHPLAPGFDPVEIAPRFKDESDAAEEPATGAERTAATEAPVSDAPDAVGDTASNDAAPRLTVAERVARSKALDDAKAKLGSLATRWKPVDPANIPARDWPVPDVLCKSNVSALAGPSSAGKTTWYLALALAMVTGRSDILGIPIHKRSRVWFWNQEDDQSELDRRLTALMIAFNIKPSELFDENGDSMIWINSGVNHPFQLAWTEGDRKVKRGDDVDRAIADIKKFGIDAFLMDPTIEFHDSNENDNVQMRKVLSFAREIAVKGECAVGMGAHTPKPDRASSKSYAGDLNAIRGGGAQGGVVRVVHTLFGASEDDAKKWTMGTRSGYVRLDMAKNNLGRRWPEPLWYQFEGVPVGMNGEPVGVLRPITLERKQKPATEQNLAASLSAALRDHLACNQWHPLSAIVPHLQRADAERLNSKNRSRTLDEVFDGANETMTDAGILARDPGRGRRKTTLMLRNSSIPQTPK